MTKQVSLQQVVHRPVDRASKCDRQTDGRTTDWQHDNCTVLHTARCMETKDYFLFNCIINATSSYQRIDLRVLYAIRLFTASRLTSQRCQSISVRDLLFLALYLGVIDVQLLRSRVSIKTLHTSITLHKCVSNRNKNRLDYLCAHCTLALVYHNHPFYYKTYYFYYRFHLIRIRRRL